MADVGINADLSSFKTLVASPIVAGDATTQIQMVPKGPDARESAFLRIEHVIFQSICPGREWGLCRPHGAATDWGGLAQGAIHGTQA